MASTGIRIAQISDLHVRRASDKHAHSFDEWIARCIAEVNASAPDYVLVTGDLTNCGHEEEYQRLRELLKAISKPYFMLAGNHDRVPALRAAFGDCAYLFETGSHLSYAKDLGPLRLISLDSTKAGRPGGYLDAERLAWLQAQLAADTQRPVLLALHHPPFAAGVWPMDWLGFVNVRELAAEVRRHPRILRIVSGHVHCARSASWAGTFACTSPSTRPQRLVIGVGWQFPVLHVEQAGFLLHSLDADGAIRTNVHRLNGAIEPLTVSPA